MWTKGILNINGVNVYYWIKYFEKGSQYGIDGGRISKLTMKENESGRDICNFDRGWDVRPKTDAAKEAYKILIEKYN